MNIQYAEDLFELLNEHLNSSPIAGAFEVVEAVEGLPAHVLLTFGLWRSLDGVIHVYEDCVKVKWHTAIRAMPEEGACFFTFENARKFIELAFIEFKFDEAQSIPVEA